MSRHTPFDIASRRVASARGRHLASAAVPGGIPLAAGRYLATLIALAMMALLIAAPQVTAQPALPAPPDGPGGAPFGPAPGPPPSGPLPPQELWPYDPQADFVDPQALELLVQDVRSRVQQPTDPYQIIDGCVATEMEALGTPGASIAIAIDGVITYTKGYGVRHLEQGGEIDATTMFRIGSTTKMMTAAALMTLVDAGQADLHAPLTDYLPAVALAPPWEASAITPHHLMSHTSGIPDTYLLFDEASFNLFTLEQWASLILPHIPLNAPPGSFWNYANPNFSLVGLIVQQESGQPFEDYVKERVWQPAGMPLTTFRPAEVIAHGDFAWGHSGNDRLSPERWVAPPLAPAGTAFSTPSELVTWALTLMSGGGHVLSPASAAAMQTPQVNLGYQPWQEYGYGIVITDYQDREDPSQKVTVYGHGGNIPGWSSQLYWVPQREVAVSILANTINSLGYSAHCVLRELAGVVPQSDEGLKTEPESWEPFVGTYAMMNQALWDYTVQITRDPGDPNYLIYRELDLGSVVPFINVMGDVFMIDSDRDGNPDPATAGLDYTFIRDPADRNTVHWLRNRYQVGQKVGQFPPQVEVTGTACSPLTFTAEMDMPQLAVRTAGLTPGLVIREGLPISPDDPSDPATASYRQDIRIVGEAGLFFAVARPENEGDALSLFVLYDANQDGLFSYPRELVGAGLPGGGGQNVLLLGGRQPAGDYQLWVHGTAIGGSDHTFTLLANIVHRVQLRVEDAPTSASQGATYQLRVCGQRVAGLTDRAIGLVEFDYGSPPRRLRIPILWSPAPTTELYLPLLTRSSPGAANP